MLTPTNGLKKHWFGDLYPKTSQRTDCHK